MSIPKKVRAYAKKIGEETCTVNYRGSGTTKHEVRIAQASVRDAYLAGWADHDAAVARFFEAVYRDPQLRTPEQRQAKLCKLIAEEPYEADQESILDAGDAFGGS